MTTKAKKKPQRPAGIPGDKYVVQIKGRWYYVINTHTKLIAAGPYNTRPEAQEVADQRERTAGR